MKHFISRIAKQYYTGALIALAILFVMLCTGTLILGMRLLNSNYGQSPIDELIGVLFLLLGDYLGGCLHGSISRARAEYVSSNSPE